MQDDDDDCRILRGGAWYLKRPSAGSHDANCLLEDGRPQFGFRLVHDDAGRVNRGISWDDFAVSERAAYHGIYNPGRRGGYLGFRLARDEK